MRQLLAVFALAVAGPVQAEPAPPSLQARVEAVLATADPGTRYGLMVVDADGREMVVLLPDQRFIPASNTKMFTTAAAFATMPALDLPDLAAATTVHLEGRGAPKLVLTGRGDARLSSAPDCTTDCLATLADAVAAKTPRVGAIVGDATWLPDQRWSSGMSWNNFPERSGTAIAALSLDSNEVLLLARPGAIGAAPSVDAGPYFAVDNRAITVASGPTTLDVERLPFERTVRLIGQIAAGAPVETIRLGIDDPAHYAAWSLDRMLRTRGVRVFGPVTSRYRAFTGRPAALRAPDPAPLAHAVPPPLLDDLVTINKVSQNQHAELLVRRLGCVSGDGAVADGIAVIAAMLERAGLPRTAYDFSDGSGMSTYNRISPRGMIAFLRWVQAQPWGKAWRGTLPIGGVDGTIARRFKGGPLAGRVFAKTGGLNATNALSGWMTARSGRELTFAFFANDVPGGASAIPTIDAVLTMIADAS